VPALSATDLTVTVTERTIQCKLRMCGGTIAIAGTNTYPTGGVPLPTYPSFGMVRNLDQLIITGQDGALTDGSVWSFDKANNKLQCLAQTPPSASANIKLVELVNTDVPGPRTLRFVAQGW
jgi:hypothetical protein